VIVENMIAAILGIETDALTSNPMTERGISAGMLVLQNDNVAALGAAALMNEIQIRVTREIAGQSGCGAVRHETFAGDRR
jgi:hypothetical protein